MLQAISSFSLLHYQFLVIKVCYSVAALQGLVKTYGMSLKFTTENLFILASPEWLIVSWFHQLLLSYCILIAVKNCFHCLKWNLVFLSKWCTYASTLTKIKENDKITNVNNTKLPKPPSLSLFHWKQYYTTIFLHCYILLY
jgi:hypothetical protein